MVIGGNSLPTSVEFSQDILFLDQWKPMEFLLARANHEAAESFKKKKLGMKLG
jgi:hypothetical protein